MRRIRLFVSLGPPGASCAIAAECDHPAAYSASSLHIVLTFLFIELTLLFGSRVLILLVLRDQIIHVALGFCKLHFVHPFPGVPVKESLAAEHCRKVFSNALEHLLDPM